MKVEITMRNITENYTFSEEVQDWDNGLYETVGRVYKAAHNEYGRCVSKIYIDGENKEAKHIGWVFEKKCYYEDTHEPYIQETWITPLVSITTKTIREYALTCGG